MFKNFAGGGTPLNLKQRQSSYELLRLICIYGIITMHTFGEFIKSAIGINMVYGNIIETVCNMGVSLFMLISGYFGAKTNWEKIIKFEIIAIFYSLLGYFAEAYISGVWSLSELVKSCLPIFSQRKWFLTAYIILLVFADFINLMPEKLSKKQYEWFLFLMLTVFSIIPTVIFFHPTDANSGKGFMNLLLMYLIGRYIRKYEKKNINYKAIVGIFLLVAVVQFGLNILATLVVYKGVGVCAVCARDCSLFIIVGSVLVFILFGKLKFYSKTVNSLARHVFEIYLFEGTARILVDFFFPLDSYVEKWYLFAIIGIYVFAIMIICVLFDTLRTLIFGKAEAFLCKCIMKIIESIFCLIGKLSPKILGKLSNMIYIDN